MTKKQKLPREAPAYIREDEEHLWPQRGMDADRMAYIPEGWSPAQVISGEYHRHMMAQPKAVYVDSPAEAVKHVQATRGRPRKGD